MWTEENPSQDAFLPRYVARLANRSGSILRSAPQSKYLMDMKYIRLKNLQLGYHLPVHVVSHVGMRSATVYISGENLWTWARSEEHTSELQSRGHLVCRLLLEKKK